MRTVRDGGDAGLVDRAAGGDGTGGDALWFRALRFRPDHRSGPRPGRPGQRPGHRPGHRRGLRSGLLAAVALLVALLAAGCGGDDTNGLEDASPEEIGSRTLEALNTASSLRVVSEVSDPASDAVTRYDLRMTATSMQGFIEADGIRAEIVRIGEDTYVRGDAGYYDSIGESDAAELLADRWVRLTPEHASRYSYYTIEGIALSITDYVATLAGEVTTEKVGDRPAVLVTSPEGTRLWAANTGEPYPLRMEMTGAYPGMIEFSEYGAAIDIQPPPDPIDLSRLG